MTPPVSELKILLLKSGNRCAFPECGKELFPVGADPADAVNRSEIAHIVAEKADGPRGDDPLPLEERDNESNLILMCEEHHHQIDTKYKYWSAERLRQLKEDHELRIQAATTGAVAQLAHYRPRVPVTVDETIYSTLFEVVGLPIYVYGAPYKSKKRDREWIAGKIVRPDDRDVIWPYVIDGDWLYAFQDLSDRNGPFHTLVNCKAAQSWLIRDWWGDPVKSVWFVWLLNGSLNKLTGRRGLGFDKDHHRFYFKPDQPGVAKEVTYRPLNQAVATRKVVWQPVTKKTGQAKPYWLHRAVNLRFQQINPTQWCLSIRPEYRVTKDGEVPEESDKIGSRVTKKKSRMFNYDLLGEVNFWRDYLSESQPRIILKYGPNQAAVISTAMLPTDIHWPGIPEKYAKPFKNTEYAEDLFSWAKHEAINFDPMIDAADWDDEAVEVEEIETNDDE